MRISLAVYSFFSRFVCRVKSGLYRSGLRNAQRPPLPVISVGNIALGGMEKTPLAMELVSYFINRGLRPALVSRGYQGKWEKRGGVVSDGKAIFGTWQDAGDEPFMIARAFPKAGVFVGADRLVSCQRAKSHGFDIAVLDDGFQHIRLHRDLDIVLHSVQGPAALREGLSALKRAHGLLLKTGGPEAKRRRIRAACPSLPVFDYSVSVKGFSSPGKDEILPASAWRGKKVMAFCGIARPDRFFSLLEESGLLVAARFSFPDHHPYPARSLKKIAGASEKIRPEAIVTTDKDGLKVVDRLDQIGPAPMIVLRIGLDLPGSFFEMIGANLPKILRSTA